MLGTYVSAALICAASMLVGRALLSLAGRSGWTWLEPAVGFGALVTVSGVGARVVGHGTTSTLGVLALVILAALVLWRGSEGLAAGEAWRAGLPVVLATGLVLTLPFVVTGRWGMLGVGFNNDLGLHLAWAEWLRSGLGPEPFGGYPLGPHGIAVAVAAIPGLSLGQAFLGEIFAIGVMTGLTALAALRELGPVRRTLAATLVAVTYLAASYFAQGAFKETAEALFVLGVALMLREAGAPPGAIGRAPASPSPTWRSSAAPCSPTASPASRGRSRSSCSGVSPVPRCAGRWRPGRCSAHSGGRGPWSPCWPSPASACWR
jgi:hypothetical protein